MLSFRLIHILNYILGFLAQEHDRKEPSQAGIVYRESGELAGEAKGQPPAEASGSAFQSHLAHRGLVRQPAGLSLEVLHFSQFPAAPATGLWAPSDNYWHRTTMRDNLLDQIFKKNLLQGNKALGLVVKTLLGYLNPLQSGSNHCS